MIVERKLDVECSKHVADKCGGDIKMKECYNNTYNVTKYFGDKFINNTWKIAYGYLNSIEGLMVRHAFIINENGDVIDPTITKVSYFDDDIDAIYVAYKVFDTFDEYIKDLMGNNNDPSLFSKYVEEENEVKSWAINKGLCV